jgi:hypothetical protein
MNWSKSRRPFTESYPFKRAGVCNRRKGRNARRQHDGENHGRAQIAGVCNRRKSRNVRRQHDGEIMEGQIAGVFNRRKGRNVSEMFPRKSMRLPRSEEDGGGRIFSLSLGNHRCGCSSCLLMKLGQGQTSSSRRLQSQGKANPAVAGGFKSGEGQTGSRWRQEVVVTQIRCQTISSRDETSGSRLSIANTVTTIGL